uniref:CHORD domain-containing protein n=1 Tax=Aegilops tauschii subsp. strangulata TaxID=200361 RepID=A0A453CPZ7_AEGTS
MFHDGMKEWSCCKQRSHDFSLFLAIPGCATGKHTTEKPVTKAVSLNSKATPPKLAPIQSSKQGVETEACSRCRQGFFCSDHGSQPKAQKPVAVNGTNTEPVEKCSVPQPKKKVVNINEPRVCKNKGCGKTYKEKDNHDAACEYHPGPAVFHDRNRGVRIFPLIKFMFMYVHPDSYLPCIFSCSGSVAMSTSRSLTNLWRYLHAQRAGTMLMPYEFTP